MRYSVQPRDQIFVKGYGSLSFANYMGKNISKNIGKELIGKHSQKLFDHDLVGNKTTDKITNYLKISIISKKLQQNNSKTIANEHEEIPK